MCDYSLEHMRSRQAVVGETLQLSRATSGSVGCLTRESGVDTAVCLVPGTIVSVTLPENCHPRIVDMLQGVPPSSRAEFVQVDVFAHRDALRFSNGAEISLQYLNGATIEVLDPAVKEIEAEALKPSAKRVTETA